MNSTIGRNKKTTSPSLKLSELNVGDEISVPEGINGRVSYGANIPRTIRLAQRQEIRMWQLLQTLEFFSSGRFINTYHKFLVILYHSLETLSSRAYADIAVPGTSMPQLGDLLTTSSKPGYAMKADPPMVGAIIGKAMESLEEGEGEILIFVTRQ